MAQRQIEGLREAARRPSRLGAHKIGERRRPFLGRPRQQMDMQFARPPEGLEFALRPAIAGSGKAPVSRAERTRRRPFGSRTAARRMASQKAGQADAG